MMEEEGASNPAEGDEQEDYALGFGPTRRPWLRARELDELWERVRYAFSDRGCGVVILTGASGSGKSTLVSASGELGKRDAAQVSPDILGRADRDGYDVWLAAPRGSELRPETAGSNETAFRKLVIVDQAERLLPPARSAEEGIGLLQKLLDDALVKARESVAMKHDRAVVVCLLVLREDDLARASVLAPVFELSAFPSAMIYRLPGLSAEERKALLAHLLAGQEDVDAGDRDVPEVWQEDLREILPIHVKIMADALIVSAKNPERAQDWRVNYWLLPRYPKLLLTEKLAEATRAGKRPVSIPRVTRNALVRLIISGSLSHGADSDLRELCYAMTRACWATERMSGGERDTTVPLTIGKIRMYGRKELWLRSDAQIRTILSTLRDFDIVTEFGQGKWGFAHDYFVAAFSELDREESRQHQESLIGRLRGSALLFVITVAVAAGLAVWNASLARTRAETKKQIAEAERDKIRVTNARDRAERDRATAALELELLKNAWKRKEAEQTAAKEKFQRELQQSANDKIKMALSDTIEEQNKQLKDRKAQLEILMAKQSSLKSIIDQQSTMIDRIFLAYEGCRNAYIDTQKARKDDLSEFNKEIAKAQRKISEVQQDVQECKKETAKIQAELDRCEASRQSCNGGSAAQGGSAGNPDPTPNTPPLQSASAPPPEPITPPPPG